MRVVNQADCGGRRYQLSIPVLPRIYYSYWLLAARNAGLALVTSARLPTIYGIREFAVAGGLMSYGTKSS